MKTMQDFPSVVGLGEIGLCPQIYGGNEDFFVKCFPLLDKKKVLILHFRLSGSIDVHARCMQILHKCYVFYFFIGTSLNQMLLFFCLSY